MQNNKAVKTNSPIQEIAVFIGASFGLAWLSVLPLWMDDRGLKAPYATPLMVVMMFTPLLASLVVHLIFRPLDLKKAFALKINRRLWKPLLAAWWVPMPLVMASIFLAALCGWYTLDLEHFSNLRAILDGAAPGTELPFSLSILVPLLMFQSVLLAPLNMFATIGEELGWRGFLHHRLRTKMSFSSTCVVIGVAWGLWHTPILLLGYNYPQHSAMGPLLFVVFCVLISFPLGALRERTSSTLPAILAHAAINASAGLVAIFHHVDHPPDAAFAGFIGVSGWIVLLPVVVMSIKWIKGVQISS